MLVLVFFVFAHAFSVWKYLSTTLVCETLFPNIVTLLQALLTRVGSHVFLLSISYNLCISVFCPVVNLQQNEAVAAILANRSKIAGSDSESSDGSDSDFTDDDY